MKNLLKTFGVSLMALTMLLTIPNMVFANVNSNQVNNNFNSAQSIAPNINAKAGIVIDAKTGQILYDKNIHQPMPIASMTKLLTIYIVLQKIHAGQLSWNQNVKITPELARFSSAKGYVNIPLKVNGRYTVYDLYRAALIGSANDAALALAKQVAGSTQNFVLMMRRQAQALGIHDAKLYNACGLSNGEIGALGLPNVGSNYENQLSASDMAIIAKQLLKQYPFVLKTTSISKMNYDGVTLNSGDLMLPHNKAYEKDMPMDGMKTGTSDATGGAFTGTMNKDGRRIITVVLHAPNAYMYDPARFTETKKIVRYVYDHYTYLKYTSHSQLPMKSIAVTDGKQDRVKIEPASVRQYWIPKQDSIDSHFLINKHLKDDNGIGAPIRARQNVGQLRLSLKQFPLKFVNQGNMNTIPMVATKSVPKIGFWAKLWRGITSWF